MREREREREKKSERERERGEVPNVAVDICSTKVSSHYIHNVLLNLILRLLSVVNVPLHNQSSFTHAGHFDGGGWHSHLGIISRIVNRLKKGVLTLKSAFCFHDQCTHVLHIKIFYRGRKIPLA